MTTGMKLPVAEELGRRWAVYSDKIGTYKE